MTTRLPFLLFLISVHLISDTNGLGFRGLSYQGYKEPPLKGSVLKSISQRWITQPLDHFNVNNNRTWQMRYYERLDFLQPNSPIFISLGGEWEIQPGTLQWSLMAGLGQTHNAALFYTEHRYYGKSKPTENLQTRNLRYLNVEQALADVAYFIDAVKTRLNLQNSSVIVFGGSYAGNMATWARIKYPHLIQGALSSSAPVSAKADFYEYYDVVRNSLTKRGGEACTEAVGSAFQEVERMLREEQTGPQDLKNLFNLCQEPDVQSTDDLAYFMNSLAEVFAATVQYEEATDGDTKIKVLCNKMKSADDTPINKLAKLVKGSAGTCNDYTFATFIRTYGDTTWDSYAARNNMRQWFFQTCTEYGYYQTSNSTQSIFGSMFNLDYFLNICTDLYGDFYDGRFLDKKIKRTNLMFGGSLPDVTNVIFSNGNIDPWHALSVLEDLNDRSPAILIDGSSHCTDLQSDDSSDVAPLTQARTRIREIIGQWLANNFNSAATD